MEAEIRNILIAGGSGLIGKRITALLEKENFKVFLLSRSQDKKNGSTFFWDPAKKLIDKTAIELADVIINLAGAGIADERWTTKRKQLILDSRISSTNLLFETLSSTTNHVQLVINASAIGIYGNTGEKIMNEESPVADDFLGKTCKQWEIAAHNFEKNNIRTVIFRIGLVLSGAGGMLPEIMKPLRFGIAPIFGKGNQFQSWIHIDDLGNMFLKAIKDKNLKGVYNAVAPNPVTNKTFVKLLGKLLHKWHFHVFVPPALLKLVLGEMAIVVTNGTRVSSKKIEKNQFIFSFPELVPALDNIISQK